MKKRLLSLLVAISMVLTFLPVSALTAAAAEDSSNGELKIGQNCYPVLDNIPHQTVNGHDITLVMAGLTMPMKIVKF